MKQPPLGGQVNLLLRMNWFQLWQWKTLCFCHLSVATSSLSIFIFILLTFLLSIHRFVSRTSPEWGNSPVSPPCLFVDYINICSIHLLQIYMVYLLIASNSHMIRCPSCPVSWTHQENTFVSPSVISYFCLGAPGAHEQKQLHLMWILLGTS